MARPLWFVELLKKLFRTRHFLARLTKVPILGSMMKMMIFEGDHLVCLPKDHLIQINQSVEVDENTVLPSQVVEYFIKKAKYRWIMNFCICRESNKCKDYPRELGCLFLGEAVLGINPKLGRLVSREEAIEHVKKCREAGLVHFIGKNKLDSIWLGIGPEEKLLTICSCCPCCCISGGLKYMSSQIADMYSKLGGIEVKVTDLCVGCGTCTKNVCFMDAIQLIDNKAVINSKKCMGCGRCVDICPRKAIQLTMHDPSIIQKTINNLSKRVSVT
ncbi:MAG: DUF362 domain-containing protein [Candidatus Helarchaeota archaeon]